ncbi:NUDIX domain-containing protein [Oceanispirochaeta sp.]|jgi:8-oxo-dGTP diphosphatase|uniref:NUDIX hydrolase n=1 Tax=Oceanispirochaeta sp. TaxID=2035350 RepID=UPI002624A6AE|nr:NUDIX domain-containing protein [Oceanispirochaeta sp.]MDA3958073.1 NUDIX domain-containing protein [Oceanispirochaeta sp.]
MSRITNIPASYLVLLKEEEVLLLQRQNTGFGDGDYSFIAGHVEKDESFSQALHREALEEAGIRLDPEHVKTSHIMHRKSDDSVRVDVFFVSHFWEGEIKNREPEKCSDLSWFPLNHLPDNMIPYIREALSLIRKGVHYSEYGW